MFVLAVFITVVTDIVVVQVGDRLPSHAMYNLFYLGLIVPSKSTIPSDEPPLPLAKKGATAAVCIRLGLNLAIKRGTISVLATATGGGAYSTMHDYVFCKIGQRELKTWIVVWGKGRIEEWLCRVTILFNRMMTDLVLFVARNGHLKSVAEHITCLQR